MNPPLAEDGTPGVDGAVAIRDAIRAGATTATAVVERTLERIAARDPVVRAFVAVDADRARHRAAELDAARAAAPSPTGLGLLHGVPIALKDNICRAGALTTAGSRILEGWRAPYDAHVVRKLDAAGAVIVGNTNQDEFAMGSSCENSAWFPTRNPWDLERVPGGSSGGSAAAVAAGMVPLALGSDTGGSIRQPAALCGVAGFKPTYGSVSRYGLVAFASSLDQIGPLARNIDDLALAFQVLAGHDPRDATSNPVAPDFSELGRDVAGLRIGVHRDYVDALPDAEVRVAVTRAIDALVARGASIVRLDDVDLRTAEALSVYYVIATSEASSNLARFDGLRYGPREPAKDLAATYAATRGDRFGAEVARRIVLGTFALSAGYREAWYRRATEVRAALREAYARVFQRADVIVGAVTPTTAFRLGENTSDPLTMYLCDTLTVPASLAGVPAASVPIALSRGGLPIAAQVIGPARGDARVLAVARAIEAAHELRDRVAKDFAVAPGAAGGAP